MLLCMDENCMGCYVYAAGLCFTPIPTSILTPAFLTIGLRGLQPLTITLVHLIFHFITSHIKHIKSRP